eukprot:Nk52_evm38s156 gene=Nk52_evmTU38s156
MVKSKELKCISPVDGSVVVTRELASREDIVNVLVRADKAFKSWSKLSIAERAVYCRKAVEVFVNQKEEIALEITKQMGRPISQAGGEVNGFEERATHMIDIAEDTLKDIVLEEKDNFNRFIRRCPLGVVLIVAPWNYPYLCAVNSIIPALMSGNTVVLKHSGQTPLCAERLFDVFKEAGIPSGVFEILHMSHENTDFCIKDPRVSFVAFTGSVPAGRSIQHSAADKFIGVGLELGGKDPAYVRYDADLDYAVENLVDGAFFNSGQSCCGIERIYVDNSLYDQFVEKFVEITKQYKLGNPLDPNTNMGPCVRTSAADWVRKQVKEAIKANAKPHIDPTTFPANKDDSPYLAPQVLSNVDHSMSVMKDESFGPVIGIMKVNGDEEAIELMNDSDFGLTASIWTKNEEAAIKIGDQVNTGTWFMNRCDYLDPALAWVGVKDSGRGCTLSALGFEQLTRPKSFHLKKTT